MADDPLSIVFDASALRDVHPDRPSAMVLLLGRLKKDGQINLLVPYVAACEWASQWADRGYREIRQAIKSLKILRGKSWASTLGESQEVANCVEEVKSVTYQELLEHFIPELNMLGFEIIDQDVKHAKEVLDSYFLGKPPFSSIKNRKDIPDGFIALSVQQAVENCGASIFVCRDKRLVKAVASDTLDVCDSVEDLLSHEAMQKLAADRELALWWEDNFSDFVKTLEIQSDELDGDLNDWMNQEGIDAWVTQQIITHSDIPEDNREARIESADSVSEIAFFWEDAQSIGEGILSVPMQFDLEMTLAFMVYRGDLVEVPDWVNVSYKDLAESHYLDAYAHRNGRLSASLVINFGSYAKTADNEKALDDGYGLDWSSAEFELEDIELVDFTDGW